MKKTILNQALTGLALAAASMAWTAPVQAQTTAANSDYSFYAPGSGYVGLNAGRSRYNYPAGAGAFANDRNANAWSLYGGSYFNNNFGFELGYNDFGRVNRAGGSTKANGISLSLVGRAPISSSFNLLGRLGGTYARTEVSAAAASGIASGTNNKFDLSYGIGAEWAFSPRASAVLQYDEYNVRYVGSGRDRLNTTTLGLRYRF